MRFLVFIALAALAAHGEVLAQPVSGSDRLDAFWRDSNGTAAALYECRLYADDLTTEEVGLCAEHEAASLATHAEGPEDLEYHLVNAIMIGGGEAAVIGRFADELGVSVEAAALAIDLQIETRRSRAMCAYIYIGCVWPDDSPLPTLWENVATLEEAPLLYAGLGRQQSFELNFDRMSGRWRSTPSTLTFLRDHYRYTQDLRLLVAMGEHALALDVLQSAFSRPPGDVGAVDQFAYFTWLLDQTLAQEMRRDERLVLTALAMRSAIRVGHQARAFADYVALRPSERRQLWSLTAASPVNAAESLKARQQTYELMVWLAAAAIDQARPDMAADLLEQADVIAVFTDEDVAIAEAHASTQRYPNLRTRIASHTDAALGAMLQEAIQPQYSPGERYNLFVLGGPTRDLVRPDVREMLRATAGWLWLIPSAPPVFGDIALDLLEGTEDTEALAAHLVQADAAWGGDWNQDVELGLDNPVFLALRASAEPSQAPTTVEEGPEIAPVPRLTVFEERPLPEGASTEAAIMFSEPTPIPAGIVLPVSEWQVVRLEPRGEVWDLIYTSTELDPTGEVSAGGYWYVQSEPGGTEWQQPVYLGLQPLFPYVILPGSSLPMIAGDRLQLAVVVRQLDPASITFPPIGMALNREEDDLMITAPLSALTRDRDEDGLTDVFEHRIGLDMSNPDTDGDGFDDGIDGLPLTPFDPARMHDAELMRLMIGEVLGHDAAAIRVPVQEQGAGLEEVMASVLAGRSVPPSSRSTLILKGEPDLFAGVISDQRLIVLDDAAEARMSPEYGITYPLGFSVILPNSDHSQVYVVWSAGWTGGEFYIRRDGAGAYELTVTSSWIT
ncbi:hypothetical protein [Maricaulis maris]|uniref:hypothetical protein n=1 Tax=Maricaulis maris TaxID=74318 RepID=UPI003B8C6256